MKCPSCGKTLKIPTYAESNMEAYRNPALVVTLCCGKLVRCYPQFSYTAAPYTGRSETDDWGNEPKKSKK